MKFEFTSEEEWDALPEPDPRQARAEVSEEDPPPSPTAVITAAAERMHTRARTDFHRVHVSLNHMLHTVEAASAQSGVSFTEADPEPGVDVFRPETFGGVRG